MKKILSAIIASVLIMIPFTNKISAQERTADSVPVLMYHTFDDDPAFVGINTKPDLFRAHLQTLKDNGFEAITGEDLEQFVLGNKELPHKPFMITIDDGYDSVYNTAYPILQELDMKATLFVITSHIESGERFGEPMMTWTQIKEMSDSSLIEVESHTHDLHWRGNNNTAGYEGMTTNTLKDGTPITDSQRKQIIIDDLNTARDLIDTNVGKSSNVFSYPYGAYDNISEQAVAEAGYTVIHTVNNGTNYPDGNVSNIKRIGINSNVTVSGLLDRLYQYVDTSNDIRGTVNVYSDNTVEAISWVDGEQYTNKGSTQDIRFELWKYNSSGKKVFQSNFGQYMIPTENKRKMAITSQKISSKGMYSLKLITLNNDGSRSFTWRDFQIK